MSGEVTLFSSMDKSALTAYLSNPELAAAAAYNEEVSNFASFPSISIKGGRFTLVQGEERQVMMRPGTDDEPAASLQMVMLRINDKARTYYEKAYDPNEVPPPKPTCYSNDNIAPSDLSIEKQSPRCATCRWAVFGTAIKQDGSVGKGTRCASNARIALAAPDALDKPHMLRVPPTSLRPLRDAIDVIRKRNIAYPLVVMKVSFVPEEASPTLKFLPVGLLGPIDAQKAIGMREDSVVRAICGLDERAPAAAAQPAQAASSAPADELGSALDGAIAAAAAAEAPPKSSPVATTSAGAPASQPAPTTPSPVAASTNPASKAAPSPSPAANAAEVGAAGAQAATVTASPPTPAKSPTEPTVVVATGGVLDELSAMLGKLDG